MNSRYIALVVCALGAFIGLQSLCAAQTALPSNATSLCDPTVPFPSGACAKPNADGSIPTKSIAIANSTPITPSDTVTVTAERELMIIDTVAGNVKIGLAGGSTSTLPIAVGITVLPWAVTQIFVTGTTATATYYNLQ